MHRGLERDFNGGQADPQGMNLCFKTWNLYGY